MSSSSFNDAFVHTPRYFTWSKNCTRTPFRKTYDGAGCLYFFGQKRTPIVFLQLKVISYSATSSPQIFKRQCSPLILGLNTHMYHQQTLDESQPYFPQCIPSCLIPAELRVHPGKQQISMGSELPLPYHIGYNKGG